MIVDVNSLNISRNIVRQYYYNILIVFINKKYIRAAGFEPLTFLLKSVVVQRTFTLDYEVTM